MNKQTYREQVILEHCKSKNVLHLGCSDSPFTEDKIRCNKLLHQKILDVSRSCVGLDLDERGIEIMTRAGIPNVYVQNVECLDDFEPGSKYDVVVLGEIVEHLSNPGLLFSRLSGKLMPLGEVIITVPNAYSLKSFFRIMFMNNEIVHPDHVCYYTYKTLKSLVERYGFAANHNLYYSHQSESSNMIRRFLSFSVNWFVSHFALMLSDGLIVVLRKESRTPK